MEDWAEDEDSDCIIVSQYRLAEHLARKKSGQGSYGVGSLNSDYNHHAFCATPLTPTPENPGLAIKTAKLPTPFEVALHAPPKGVKREDQPCAKCFQPLKATGVKRPVTCDHCGETWHLVCGGLSRAKLDCGLCPGSMHAPAF